MMVPNRKPSRNVLWTALGLIALGLACKASTDVTGAPQTGQPFVAIEPASVTVSTGATTQIKAVDAKGQAVAGQVGSLASFSHAGESEMLVLNLPVIRYIRSM